MMRREEMPHRENIGRGLWLLCGNDHLLAENHRVRGHVVGSFNRGDGHLELAAYFPKAVAWSHIVFLGFLGGGDCGGAWVIGGDACGGLRR